MSKVKWVKEHRRHVWHRSLDEVGFHLMCDTIIEGAATVIRVGEPDPAAALRCAECEDREKVIDPHEARISQLEEHIATLKSQLDRVMDHLWPDPSPGLSKAREEELAEKARPHRWSIEIDSPVNTVSTSFVRVCSIPISHIPAGRYQLFLEHLTWDTHHSSPDLRLCISMDGLEIAINKTDHELTISEDDIERVWLEFRSPISDGDPETRSVIINSAKLVLERIEVPRG